MSSQRPPSELIESAQAGDRTALEDLVLRYSDQVDRHVRLRLGAHLRQRVEIEDVLQETVTRACQSIESFQWRGEHSFLKWLKGIAEHVILKLAYKTRRDHVFLVEYDDLPASAVSPSHSLRRCERFERLQEALDRLSADHREVIVLSRLKGLQANEIARRMGRSRNAVAQLLSHALQKLKEAFGDTESLHLPAQRLDSEGASHD